MPIDQSRTHALFRKLDRLARKLADSPAAEDVHQFRTTTRRVETLLQALVPDADKNERKLLKQLGKIRKRAGRVRDLDVLMDALKTVRIGRDSERKNLLMSNMSAERENWQAKLAATLDGDNLRILRKRLGRAALDPNLHNSKYNPVKSALRQFAELSRKEGPIAEPVLHQYRLRCKRIRYVAEMAGNDAQAKLIVDHLKHLQDAVGEWHDWDVLTGRAEQLFSDQPATAMVAAIRSARQGKLAEALRVAADSRKQLLQIWEASRRQRKPVVSVAREAALSGAAGA